MTDTIFVVPESHWLHQETANSKKYTNLGILYLIFASLLTLVNMGVLPDKLVSPHNLYVETFICAFLFCSGVCLGRGQLTERLLHLSNVK